MVILVMHASIDIFGGMMQYTCVGNDKIKRSQLGRHKNLEDSTASQFAHHLARINRFGYYRGRP